MRKQAEMRRQAAALEALIPNDGPLGVRPDDMEPDPEPPLVVTDLMMEAGRGYCNAWGLALTDGDMRGLFGAMRCLEAEDG